jgi:hypothetical protein
MTVREIQGHLSELYGIDVSLDLISRVTDAVLEEVREWQILPRDWLAWPWLVWLAEVAGGLGLPLRGLALDRQQAFDARLRGLVGSLASPARLRLNDLLKLPNDRVLIWRVLRFPLIGKNGSHPHVEPLVRSLAQACCHTLRSTCSALGRQHGSDCRRQVDTGADYFVSRMLPLTRESSLEH